MTYIKEGKTLLTLIFITKEESITQGLFDWKEIIFLVENLFVKKY